MFDTLKLAVALKSIHSQNSKGQSIADRLEALEKVMERCKVLYEQYFMGIQKIAPAQLHRDAERKIRELTQLQIRNTAMRFKFTTLSQKFGSYNSYWRRTMRAIEQGKYVRDIQRATRRASRHGANIPEELLAAMPKRMREKILRDRKKLAQRAGAEQGREKEKASRRPGGSNVHQLDADGPLLGDLDFDNLFETLTAQEERKTEQKVAHAGGGKPVRVAGKFEPRSGVQAKRPPPPPKPLPAPGSRSAKPVAAKPQRPRPSKNAPPGMTAAQTRALFQRYIAARKKTGERTDNITYDKLVSTLSRQAPKIMKKHGVAAVDFSVSIKGDQVVLKAKPKK